MKVQQTEFKKGEIVVITEGEYSDYGPIGDVEILKDFRGKDVRITYMAETGHFSAMEFVSWLSSHGYIQDVEVRTPEMYLGSCGWIPFEDGL